ncbi:phosphate ABC transporter ATP-binding protein PstB [Salicibibacter kimchii]|uniref:Phosphate ABC transporter ATP-binding protein n=1 Tax=Salicibibacter kimchii TaxID=2099786 RepID=A0A345BY57_9BACI|nr:phosphate ABC transporter ATP-binding protein PstB [Salicibibacter kimchii]AXF55888.1 phosphate ABC transporter ATP-binding protein [Salicibibacter kimchii]
MYRRKFLGNGGRTLTEAIFETENLKVAYGENQVINGIDWNINKGEITALIGPSGCGKSTFLKTLNLLIRSMSDDVKLSGSITFSGKNILSDKIDAIDLRKQIGMVFQQPNPFPKSVFDNVAYGPRIHGVKKKRQLQEIVEQSLSEAYLWDEVKDRLHDSARGLSGGQQQRLCIARALATKPDVLLMDEPTSALDPISTMGIEDLIRKLQGQYTVIMVTHQMEQAARLSDTTAFLYMGDLIETNKTSQLFSNPSEKQTEDYITGKFG